MRVTIETDGRLAVHDVTDRIAAAIPGNADGLVTVFVRHTTAGVVVNEPESRLLGDVEGFLAQLVPEDGWDHDRIDDNADAHLRALLLGEHVTVPVADGDPDLGTWQAILLIECDGPRERTLDVAVQPAER